MSTTVTVRYTDRRVLAEIHRYTTLPKGAFPSYQTLATNLKLGVSTVRGAVYRLVRRGVLKVTARLRKNGSQTTNAYTLCIPLRAVVVAPRSTPYEAPKELASSDTPLSGGRERRSRHKINSMSKPAPDDWDSCAVAGATTPDPTESTERTKFKVSSGNNKVTRTPDPERPAVVRKTWDELKSVTRAVRKRDERTKREVATWSSADLARAWRDRLWDKGLKVDRVSVQALTVRFAELMAAGVSSERLDAISQAFFADRRNTTNARTDIYKLFIAMAPELLQESSRTGYYRKGSRKPGEPSPFARATQAYAARKEATRD